MEIILQALNECSRQLQTALEVILKINEAFVTERQNIPI